MISSKMYWSAFLAALVGILQSYAFCCMAGALPFIAAEFSLSPAQEGFAAGSLLLGALAGVVLCGAVVDRLGRRKTFFIAILLLLLATGVCCFAVSYPILVGARIFQGVFVGLSSALIPLYLAEIAPAASRGAFVTVYQLSLTIGTAAAYLVNFLYADSGDWKAMLCLPLIPAAILALFLPSLAESPVRLAEIPSSPPFSRFRKTLAICLILSVFQQLTAINIMVSYTPRLFELAGCARGPESMLPTLLVGLMNLFATAVSLILIDRLGRRILLLASQSGMVLGLLALSLLFGIPSCTNQGMLLAILLFFMFSYALGAGPVTWVLISELFPLPVRGKGVSLMVIANWGTAYVVVQTFPSLIDWLGTSLSFLPYAFASIIGLALCSRLVPETTGKNLGEIHDV